MSLHRSCLDRRGRGGVTKAMVAVGTHIEETGTLVRDGGGFVLQRDLGGRYELELQRLPVDHVEKRVRITGVVVGQWLVSVDGVAPL